MLATVRRLPGLDREGLDHCCNGLNFPFVTLADDGTHVLEKGTPLVQVIPFRRHQLEASVRAETPAEALTARPFR